MAPWAKPLPKMQQYVCETMYTLRKAADVRSLFTLHTVFIINYSNGHLFMYVVFIHYLLFNNKKVTRVSELSSSMVLMINTMLTILEKPV